MPIPPPSAQRQLFSFDDEKASCSSVNIDGYGTYCVKQEGPVCGVVQGNCPVQGEAAINNCIKTSKGFSTGCVAPSNAKCVERKHTKDWMCKFDDISADGTKSEEVAPVESLSSADQSLSVSTQSPSNSMLSGVGISLNVAVVVACCVLAFVGLVLVKRDATVSDQTATHCRKEIYRS